MLATTDEDAAETFSYSIQGGADAAKFTIGGVGSNGVIDFEAKSSYSVNLRVTDGASNAYDETLTVNVNDLNEVPVLTLTSARADLDEDTETSSPAST